jgi:hypothetical protein
MKSHNAKTTRYAYPIDEIVYLISLVVLQRSSSRRHRLQPDLKAVKAQLDALCVVRICTAEFALRESQSIARNSLVTVRYSAGLFCSS